MYLCFSFYKVTKTCNRSVRTSMLLSRDTVKRWKSSVGLLPKLQRAAETGVCVMVEYVFVDVGLTCTQFAE